LAAYAFIVFMALGMRLWDLGPRALHHDESLHAYFSWDFYTTGGFEHNPMMHGPFQFEANAGVFRLFGDSDFTVRLLYVFAGTLLVLFPYFLRHRLGRLGALAVSVLLAFSPSLFYYSRFTREDILMAFWTFGIIICMWRYLDEGKNRYLYIGTVFLAFAFATKESVYLLVATLGGYLTLVLLREAWERARVKVSVEGLSPVAALWRVVSAVWAESGGRLQFSGLSRPGIFLLLLVTLTLPQWSAVLGLLQSTPLWPFPNLVLLQPNSAGGSTGAPSGGGITIAFLTVILLLLLSVYLGFRWRWGVWWRCALVFYAIWVVLYTTFFTNWSGIGTGMWQGLGYWIQQQGVARGDQPWYYYFLITPLYEFLALFLALIGAVYYLRKRDNFGIFLVIWLTATFILYTAASEKMPWLLVHIALPLAVIGGKFLGDVVNSLRWSRTPMADWLLVLAGVPLTLVLLWRLAFYGVGGVQESGLLLAVVVVVLAALVGLGAYMARRIGVKNFAVLTMLPIVVALFVITVRTGFRASYQNGDIAVEMLIYTQSTPDIPRLSAAIDRESEMEGKPKALPVTIDSTSGFQWPWAWYLRDDAYAGYPSYGGDAPKETPTDAVLLIHHNNNAKLEPMLRDGYKEGMRFKFRWWFPEQTYRNLTVRKFFRSFGDREAWRRTMDYFLYRKMRPQHGSEDGILYLSKDFETEFRPMP
jgi:predicted membrane-bound mannosyltransferase